ncbi:MAG: hypothetical protein ABL904_16135, partial [Hyphomicrobiaceae bacterium]
RGHKTSPSKSVSAVRRLLMASKPFARTMESPRGQLVTGDRRTMTKGRAFLPGPVVVRSELGP